MANVSFALVLGPALFAQFMDWLQRLAHSLSYISVPMILIPRFHPLPLLTRIGFLSIVMLPISNSF